MRATELMFRNPAQATPGFYDSDVSFWLFLIKSIANFHWWCCKIQVDIKEPQDKSSTE